MFLIKVSIALAIPFLLAAGLIMLVGSVLTIDDLAQCPKSPDPSDSNCQKADAIVAISGGDTAARTETAIELYKLGWADRLIVSGAAADKNGPSNAEVMRQQALAAGVPDAAITTDAYSNDTAGNAADLSVIAKLQGLQRIVLVSSPYHQRRAEMEFQKVLGKNVTILSHPTPNDRYWPPSSWWLNPNGWYLAVVELVKLGFVQVGLA
jgi:uncharacterized SAM-binding protein YcdF (DUF218 family)